MTPVLPDTPAVEAHIVEMTNVFRQSEKLAPTRSNPALTAAARAYAGYLARSGKFSHTADGREVADRTAEAGYQHCQVAENLASNLDSRGFSARDLAGQAVEGWKKSPGHRRNMLLPYVTETGVGVVKAPDKHPKYISVQLFGRPKSLAYSFQIVNEGTIAVSYRFAGEDGTSDASSIITHTACEPAAVEFLEGGGLLSAAKVTGRYDAADGDVYKIVRGDKGPRIEVKRKAVAR